ncbi:MAG: hypothetical protein ACOCRX_11945 [Candidatus Woesearchaeota archaeon]
MVTDKAYRKLVKVVEEENLSGNDLYLIATFFFRQYIDWLTKRNIVHYMDNRDFMNQYGQEEQTQESSE